MQIYGCKGLGYVNLLKYHMKLKHANTWMKLDFRVQLKHQVEFLSGFLF